MKVVPCIQGDATWHETRLGMLTASRISDALAKLKKGGDSAARKNYMLDLAVERITRKPTEHYMSEPMRIGVEREPLALAAYEIEKDCVVERVGFVLHPTIEWSGASPDGIVGDGLVQVKCPLPRTHATYLIADKVPAEYVPQCMWELACTGKAYTDFISYCPEFPPELRLFICRLERDDALIGQMEAEARVFLDEVAATVTQLRGGLEGLLDSALRDVAQRNPYLTKAVIPEMVRTD